MHVGITNTRWRGKRSRHSRRMRSPQIYVSGKRPVTECLKPKYLISGVWQDCRIDCHVSDGDMMMLLYIHRVAYGFSNALQWRHNERDGVSNHQRLDYLLNRLFRRRSKKTSKLRATHLCEWNAPVTGEFPAHRASKAGNISIWWRHHVWLSYNMALVRQAPKLGRCLNSVTET